MKGNTTNQLGRVNLVVLMLPNLKRRLEEAAQKEGMTDNDWVLKAIEARLDVHDAKVEKREDVESPEYQQEQKLDELRAMGAGWRGGDES